MIDLPAAITDYIASNYSGYVIEESKEEVLCGGAAVYEVELEGSNEDELELVFSQKGDFLYSETEIGTSALPSAVSNSATINYPDYNIDEADRLDLADDGLQYELELEKADTELEVLFDTEGTVICEQEDDDE